VAGDPFYYTWNFGSSSRRRSEIADFEPIFARSALVVTTSEKSSINTNRKSTTRFPLSLKMIVVRCPYVPWREGGSKTQNDRFPSKIALRLKKLCYRLSLYENCRRPSCKAFIGLTNAYKNDWYGGDSFYLKFWIKLTALERNRRFSIYLRLTPSEKTSSTRFPMSPR